MSSDWGWHKMDAGASPDDRWLDTASGPMGRRGASSAAWMVTFSDLTLLLLTFFVLLFSMSTLRTEAWTAFVDGVSTRFEPVVERPTPETSPEFAADSVVAPPAEDLRYLQAVIAEAQVASPVLDAVQVIPGGDRLLLALPAAPEAALMTELAGLLDRLDNRVRVAVSLDGDAALHDRERRESWDDGLARAEAVAASLRRAGYPQSVDVFAHVASVAVAGTGAPRLPRSRPVAIVVLPEGRE